MLQQNSNGIQIDALSIAGFTVKFIFSSLPGAVLGEFSAFVQRLISEENGKAFVRSFARSGQRGRINGLLFIYR